MPLIDTQVLEGVFTAEEKERLIFEVARAFCSAANQRLVTATTVRVHDGSSGQWGGVSSVWTTERALTRR